MLLFVNVLSLVISFLHFLSFFLSYFLLPFSFRSFFRSFVCSFVHLSIFDADNVSNIHGVLYDFWNTYTTSDKSSTILKFNEVFGGPPEIASVSPSFTIPGFSGLSNYTVREKGYAMVSILVILSRMDRGYITMLPMF